MIVQARRDRPTAEYLRASGVDGHNQRYRYLWEVRIDGQVVMPGMRGFLPGFDDVHALDPEFDGNRVCDRVTVCRAYEKYPRARR